MREILFRGEAEDNGDWVIGSLVDKKRQDISGPYLLRSIFPDDFYADEEIIVSQETVGQYTELKDRTGEKIFEGDIIKGDIDFMADERVGLIGKIIFSSGRFCFSRPTKIGPDVCELYTLHNVEVIGNIHDNPELLK